MYLMRIGEPGAERPAARIDDESYVDLSEVVDDFDEAFFGGGGLDRIRPVVAERAAADEVSRFAGERVGAPIARPHQILCIGLNYRDHAAETGQAVPDEPILFNKSPNTLIGPYDDVRIPRGSTKPDWEVELGIVIGRRTSYLDSVVEASGVIAGYLVVNDVSERAFQIERGGQWVKGKSAETFNPAGPWLVTPEEIDDVLALDMWLDVNGVRRQTGNEDDGLRSVLHRALPQSVPRPGAGRPDQHRDSAGCGYGLQPAGVAATRRRDGAGRRGLGVAAAARGRAEMSARSMCAYVLTAGPGPKIHVDPLLTR